MEAVSASDMQRHYQEVRRRLNPPPVKKVAPPPVPLAWPVRPPIAHFIQRQTPRYNRGRVCGAFGEWQFGDAIVMHPTVPNILRAVAQYYNLSLTDLISKRRTQAIVRPRHVAMYLARTLTTRSVPEIGRRFGDRDHTTILHGARRIADLMQSDPDLAEDVQNISERFRVPA